MKALFYTELRCLGATGGTERATVTVASTLGSRFGWECYSAYRHPQAGTGESCFMREFALNADRAVASSELAEVARAISADALVVEGDRCMPSLLRAAGLPKGTALVFCHHYEPAGEMRWYDPHAVVTAARAGGGAAWLKAAAKFAGWPLWHGAKERGLRSAYRESFEAADRVVLLCAGYASRYLEFAQVPSEGAAALSKFAIIPNALSDAGFLNPAELERKSKTVLIVSRFDERLKRISLALEAWARAKESPDARGWTLRIVGYGPDEGLYRRMVERNRIPDVEFAGRHDAVGGGDYRDASIFLMSSASESWGITLTEAQQMGCVPVAFDSYAAVREIVEDGVTGLLVPWVDIDSYARAIVTLMANPEKRNAMALAAVESSKRFSQERVGAMWDELLRQMATSAATGR